MTILPYWCDFNTEKADPYLSGFSTSYDFKSLVKDKTSFKNSENPRCIDLFIISR